MDIWIIRDGEKTGPLRDYDVRRKIESGEFGSSTMAWHEGLATWMPLGEISLFEREFKLPSAESAEEPAQAPVPPPLPDQPYPVNPEGPHLARRFWARWLDLNLYSAVFWLALWASGRDLQSAMSDPLVILPHYVPWFVLEIILIHRFGTTPGKWLLGLRVLNGDGSRLDLAQSTKRALGVFVMGIGLGWDILPLFCMVISLVVTRRTGKPLWDHGGGHQVLAEPLRAGRLLAHIGLFLLAGLLQSLVLFPPYVKERMKQDPEFRRNFEKMMEDFQRGSKR